jgi:leucyl aminopeptidase
VSTSAGSDRDTAVAPTPPATVRLVDTDPAELAVDAIVIGVYSQDASAPAPLRPASGAESVAVAFDGKLTDTLVLLGATGAAGEGTSSNTPCLRMARP